MKTKININGKDVEITLTPDQVKEIKKLDLKITDRVKSFPDACEITGITDELKLFLNINSVDKNMRSTQAYVKLQIITKALNEDWLPDFSNPNEYKYYSWFKFDRSSGFRFDGSAYGVDNSTSDVGSRLCLYFRTKEISDYFGKQFLALHKKAYNK